MKKPLREKLCAPLGNRLWAALLAFFIFSLISPPAPALAERMSDGFDPGTVLPAVYSTTTLHASDFYGRNSDTPLEIPGVSRLMTLYLAVERLSADEQIPISRVAAQYDEEAPEQGEMVLLAGDRVPLRFLLLKMLFENSDTAAVAIAEKISGSQDAFLDEMQKSATTLGMTRTVFHAVDIRKTEEDAGLPPEITEAISLYDDYMQSDEHTALVLPESRQDAEIDDGDPEIGYFSPWSWWPITLAFGAALVFLGLAVGIWVSFIGAPIAFLAIVGWYYEHYRGNFAR